MTALPAAASFTGSSVTEADFKSAITDLRAYLAGLHGTDGVAATALATLGSLLTSYVAKSASYTVLAADRGKLINCTAGLTLTTPAAATVGAGFAFGVRNSGAGTVTLDGNASELVDGAATVAIGAGESALVVSTGTAWLTVGRTAGIADGSIVTAKLASAMGAVTANTNAAQTLTATYATYLTTNVVIDADDAVVVFGSVAFEFGPHNDATGTPNVGLRLLVNGSTVATNVVPTYITTSDKLSVTLPIAGRVTGLAAGTRAIALQVYLSTASVSYNTYAAKAGSLIAIKEPT